MCQGTDRWTETLPLVLLGLRSAVREEIGTSAAGLTYGTTLKLPGDFFVRSEATDPGTFVRQLQENMATLRPTPTSAHRKLKTFVHRDLKSCKWVFLRQDAARKPLQPVYDGPVPVEGRDEKTIEVRINGKIRKVSIGRTKPAFITEEEKEQSTALAATPPATSSTPPAPAHAPPAAAPAPPAKNLATHQTRTGRKLQLPVRFR